MGSTPVGWRQRLSVFAAARRCVSDVNVADLIKNSAEQRQLRAFVRRHNAEMLVGFRRELAAARCADDQLGPQEKRLDLIDERIEGRVHRMSDGLDAGWSTVEHPPNGFEIFAVLRVETKLVDAE